MDLAGISNQKASPLLRTRARALTQFLRQPRPYFLKTQELPSQHL